MDIRTVSRIFERAGLPTPQTFEKMAVGFSNDVYAIDDKYILKVCTDVKNQNSFRVEAVLCAYFAGTLPVPGVLAYDDSQSRLRHHYLLYDKIDGENLYNVWHTYTKSQRRAIVKQLCEMLRHINETDVNTLPSGALLQPLANWRQYIVDNIEKYLSITENVGTVSAQHAETIRSYVVTHAPYLDDAKIALTYWDAHFDNILVKEGCIVGLLDFERTELASIDFALDLVKRMVDHPKKYMSEYAEQFARDEDYADLMTWYQEFYPELFAFTDMNHRLKLYAISHNLEDLENWPEAVELVDEIMSIITSP